MAVRLRRNPETIRRWIREGRLRATRNGGRWVIDEHDIEALAPQGEALSFREWADRALAGLQARNRPPRNYSVVDLIREAREERENELWRRAGHSGDHDA
ncbi:MAG TPA: helix-turn-helix domain-containing protein [Candidatus Dormibacteraeota bacterium]|nr:helix-turn-helix domain-containing protein [Candidatus Dormibacteraeota bacterium]